MGNNVFDIGCIGAGMAGALFLYKMAKDHKDVRMIIFDQGRPPAKRKRQMEGFLGCFPSSDGKLYLSNLEKVSKIIPGRKVEKAHKFFNRMLSNLDNFCISYDPLPSETFSEEFRKQGFSILPNDYIQIMPKDVHAMSRMITAEINEANKISLSFDNEVFSVSKKDGMFIVETEDGEFFCKKVVICVGRSGWRWCHNLFKRFGIIANNDIARFGVRIELNANYMKEMNKSVCSLIRNDLEIGPFDWNGTVLPEDHMDHAIAGFRANEDRWKSEKVSFNMIGVRKFMNGGAEQVDRLGRLTFILANERIMKEKVSYLIGGKSKISIIPEYDFLKNEILRLGEIIPEIITKASMHTPTLIPGAGKINLSSKLETEVDGMFVAGESFGVSGLMAAAVTGIMAADGIVK
jgi:hypothetical protein